MLFGPKLSKLFAKQFLFLVHFTAKLNIASTMTMRAAQFTPGGPENLYIGDDVPIPELKEKEVLLKVYSTAINRAETLQRKGMYPHLPGESDILGLEAAGKIEKLGSGCSGKWNVGDRVMALLPGGGNAEYVAAYEDHLIPVPKNMTFNKAAAIPEVWLTAYQLLHFVGKLKPQDTVLIHAGGSGVGTAAVQLVKQHGARSIVTAGSQAKIEFAKGLGAFAGFNYKEGPWSDKVLEATSGKGVDMILDCVLGSYWEQNTAVLAVDSTWVLYGTLGGLKINNGDDLPATILRKRVTLVGSTLKARNKEYKTDLVNDFTKKAIPLFENATFQAIIDQTLPLDDLSEAHRLMEASANTGKLVIEVRKEDAEKDEL